jgi:DNA transformation protein
MANSKAFVAHVLEMMRPAGAVSARAMFGGHGVYLDGLIVGLVDDDMLYLKTDAETRAAFVALDLPPFRYRGHDGDLHDTGYFRAPDDALESPPAMREWLRMALAAALRAQAAKSPSSRRRAPADKPRTRGTARRKEPKPR